MEDIRHKIGDKVVCINTGTLSGDPELKPKLVKGKIYLVLDTRECTNCKRQLIDVGLIRSEGALVCKCDHIVEISHTHLCDSSRFRKVEETGLSNEEDKHMSSLIQETLSPALV